MAFKSAGASAQSTAGSRGVRISGSSAGYTVFRGSVKSTGYPLHSPVSLSISPPLRHRVPSHFNWSLIEYEAEIRVNYLALYYSYTQMLVFIFDIFALLICRL